MSTPTPSSGEDPPLDEHDLALRRVGMVRGRDGFGKTWAANPGDAFFSTVTMFASEWWDGTNWKPLFDE